MFQERLSVEADSDFIGVNAEKDRWFVKRHLSKKADRNSTSHSNDECSDTSGGGSIASGIGKPAKLPSGILGGSKERSNTQVMNLKRLLNSARREAVLAKADVDE